MHLDVWGKSPYNQETAIPAVQRFEYPSERDFDPFISLRETNFRDGVLRVENNSYRKMRESVTVSADWPNLTPKTTGRGVNFEAFKSVLRT